MDPRRPPEYTLELTADRSNLKDVVKGILHTIFFHRFFPPLHPSTHEILSLTLPLVTDPTITQLVDTRTSALIRSLSNPPISTTSNTPTRAQLVVQFLEKKRRKSGWFVTKADEETVWENWVIDLTVTGSGSGSRSSGEEAARNRSRAVMERSLADAVMRVVLIVNRERDHIPPITTNEANPFPCQILVNPGPEQRGEGWGAKMGIF